MCKKLILLFIGLSLLIIFLPGLGILHRHFHGEKIGVMTREEFFRNLSFRYYGTGEFAEELELVNRALDICPPEKIKNIDLIIPDPESISRLRAKRTMQIKTEKNLFLAQNPQHQSLVPTLVLLFQLHLLLNQMILPIIVFSAILVLIIRLIRNFRDKTFLKSEEFTNHNRLARSNDKILIEFDVTKLDENGKSSS